jgi:hypothetical protein
MYDGVPSVTPVCVRRASLSCERATPKSRDSARPVAVSTKMFSGFRRVDDVVRVRERERCATSPRISARPRRRERPLLGDHLLERAPGDARHSECEAVAQLAHGVDAHDVRVLEPRDRPGLAGQAPDGVVGAAAAAAGGTRTTLSATSRPRRRSRARYTTALPPRPSSPSSS